MSEPATDSSGLRRARALLVAPPSPENLPGLIAAAAAFAITALALAVTVVMTPTPWPK